MKLWTAVWRQHRGGILLYCLCGVVFLLTFYLYRLPLAAVLYPLLLCGLLGLGALVWETVRLRRVQMQLQELSRRTAATMERLPAPLTATDESYQQLIRQLQREVAGQATDAAVRYQNTVEYFTVWAHQIKTPIAAMRLALQAEDTPLARRLTGELFRIEQYVEMVLTYLRLDSTDTDYVFRRQPLDPILRGCFKRFSHEFIDRRLRLDFTPTDLTIVTDEKWLSFVLEQLLSNALKYTRQGSVTVSLSGPTTLCIRDTGIGIAPEDLPRIFDRGYTGYNGRSDKKATGIGLYLCRRVCRGLGIGIRAESRVDVGTAVYLELEQYDLKAE